VFIVIGEMRAKLREEEDKKRALLNCGKQFVIPFCIFKTSIQATFKSNWHYFAA